MKEAESIHNIVFVHNTVALQYDELAFNYATLIYSTRLS